MLNFDIQLTLKTRCTINSTVSQRTVPPLKNDHAIWDIHLQYIHYVHSCSPNDVLTSFFNAQS